MTTRQQILQDAFEAIKIASYEFDLEPDEIASADRMLDRMIAQWGAEGVALGHTPSDEVPDVSDEMTTPDWADEALSLNLALRLAPTFGKTVAPETRRQARAGYQLILTKTRSIPKTLRANSQIVGGGDRFARALWRA